MRMSGEEGGAAAAGVFSSTRGNAPHTLCPPIGAHVPAARQAVELGAPEAAMVVSTVATWAAAAAEGEEETASAIRAAASTAAGPYSPTNGTGRRAVRSPVAPGTQVQLVGRG